MILTNYYFSFLVSVVEKKKHVDVGDSLTLSKHKKKLQNFMKKRDGGVTPSTRTKKKKTLESLAKKLSSNLVSSPSASSSSSCSSSHTTKSSEF